MNEDKVPVMVQSKRDLQSISQNFCQNIPNFVPKLASPLDYFNSWASRGLVYKLAFEFQYELLDFVTNLRTLERNLEYFGKSFVKSTVSLLAA